MKKTLIRTLLVGLVLTLGVVLVLALSYMGKETSGPVEDFFERIGSAISRVENKFILGKREKTRSKGLAWLNEYKFNPERLKNPTTLFIGAYDDMASETFQEIVDLEDTLQTVFPLIQVYTAWGSKREQKFPARTCQIISAIGSIPVITWEPWLTDFSKESLPGIPDESVRDQEGLKAISRGVYDVYIDSWALDAKAFGKSIFVRFGHEMNDPYRYPWGPQNNAPEDFIAAWRHVVERFRLAGANNVLWVWSPHPAYGLFDEYFPGSDVVDWIGVGTLNYGTVAPWSQWWSFDEIFAKHYELLAHFEKPIMISEFGSLAVGGNRSLWFHEALADLPYKYPMVKALLYFHCASDATTTYQTLNWYFIKDRAVVDVIKDAQKGWPKAE